MDSYYIGVLMGSFLMGALLGLVPGIVGFKKDKKGLAIAGFFACIAGSFILGLFLSIPACIVFTVIIVVTSKKQDSYRPYYSGGTPSAPGAPYAAGGRCVKCGGPVTVSQTFCPACGAKQANLQLSSCPSCKNAVKSGEIFCPSCGTRLR